MSKVMDRHSETRKGSRVPHRFTDVTDGKVRCDNHIVVKCLLYDTLVFFVFLSTHTCLHAPVCTTARAIHMPSCLKVTGLWNDGGVPVLTSLLSALRGACVV